MSPDNGPVEIYYREWGSGLPLIFLHGGWGYEVYPFDRQIEAFSDRFRILIPDRTGYGRSPRMGEFPTDFHSRAAIETTKFLDALGIERAVLWGHSDGAVISAIMGLAAPSHFTCLVLEAFHYDRSKPNSRDFFEAMVSNPERFGERVCKILAREHGEDYWRQLLAASGRAWLKIMSEADQPDKDFYGGRLSELSVPTLFIHGGKDPRTEPDELEKVRILLPQASFQIIEGGGHSPHSEPAVALESNRRADEFFRNNCKI